MRRALVILILLGLGVVVGATQGAEHAKLRVEREPGRVFLRGPSGNALVVYQTERPRAAQLSVESGCFFHPLYTPAGVALTDLAPPDHRHHRGIFLGWVEMRGRKNADFWGWGAHAPTQDCRIVSRGITGIWQKSAAAGFRTRNDWMAGDDPLVREDLEMQLKVVPGAHVLDLEYRLRTDEDLTLVQWAFSGFCVRGRKDGSVVAHAPGRIVDLPNPDHLKPESDWPDAPWYAFAMKLPGDVQAGMAVLSHPKNPRTRWYNDRDIRVLNPSITALGDVTLKAKKPLLLRYRVVAFDGPIPGPLLDSLAAEWAR
jgi:hypothetical protein